MKAIKDLVHMQVFLPFFDPRRIKDNLMRPSLFHMSNWKRRRREFPYGTPGEMAPLRSNIHHILPIALALVLPGLSIYSNLGLVIGMGVESSLSGFLLP